MTTKIENVKVLFLLYLALKKEFVKAISIKKESLTQGNGTEKDPYRLGE